MDQDQTMTSNNDTVDEQKPETMDVEAAIDDFGEVEMLEGQLRVECSCSFFATAGKGEDRFTVVVGGDQLENCQKQMDPQVPRMMAFAGVFDGHDGPLASEYIAEGLLPHILSETAECIHMHGSKWLQKVKAVDGTITASALEAGYVNAFHRAEERFAANESPPTLEEVKGGVQATRLDKGGLCSQICPPPRRPVPLIGGTTATTLAVYAEKSHPDDASSSPVPYAFIANTGDSRIITDDGSGTSFFRQVTVDHRPSSAAEASRLREFVQRGIITVRRFSDEAILRVFPGSISVSRTIGDKTLNEALSCTPDTFRVPLLGNDEESRTQRFILACDGLYDVMSNEEVGRLAARRQRRGDPGVEVEVIVSPKEAATLLMEECLRNGGYMDDVTIVVFDVTCTIPKSEQHPAKN